MFRRYKILVQDQERDSGAVSETQSRQFEGDLANAPEGVSVAIAEEGGLENVEPKPRETPEQAEERLKQEEVKKQALKHKREEPANVVKSWLSHLPKDIDAGKANMHNIDKLVKIPSESRKEYKQKFAAATATLIELRASMEDASASQKYDVNLPSAKASVVHLQALAKEWNSVVEIYDPDAVKKAPAPGTTKKRANAGGSEN